MPSRKRLALVIGPCWQQNATHASRRRRTSRVAVYRQEGIVKQLLHRFVDYVRMSVWPNCKRVLSNPVFVLLFKYGLGIVLLGWVIWQNRKDLDQASHRDIRLPYLLLAAVIYLAGLLITFYRWYVLVRAQDLPFTHMAALRLGLIGTYLSTFLPGSVGGDIIKAAFIAREQSRRTVAVATVIADRFFGLCGLVCLVALIGTTALFGGYVNDLVKPERAFSLVVIIFVSLGMMLGLFTAWFIAGFVSETGSDGLIRRLERVPKIGHSLAELWRALYMYRRRGRSIAAALALSMVGHILFVLTFYFSALTVAPADDIPTLGAHFLIVPVGMIIAAAVPTPGGIGGGEWGFGALYEMVGCQAADGVLGSLVQRVITWVIGLIGYLVYLRMKPSLQPLAATAGSAAAVPGEGSQGSTAPALPG
jgi:glycosyltransferase 2 family protein